MKIYILALHLIFMLFISAFKAEANDEIIYFYRKYRFNPPDGELINRTPFVHSHAISFIKKNNKLFFPLFALASNSSYSNADLNNLHILEMKLAQEGSNQSNYIEDVIKSMYDNVWWEKYSI